MPIMTDTSIDPMIESAAAVPEADQALETSVETADGTGGAEGPSESPLGAQAATDSAPPWLSETRSQHWLAWCAEIGEQTLPVLSDLHRRIPQTTSAMLCTPDGFNLCALGLEEVQVGRLAALTSSLYAVSTAAVTDTQRGGGKTLDYVTLASGDSLKVVIAIPNPNLGRLLLWARAEGVALGVLLVGVRAAADQIRRTIAVASPPPEL